MSIMTHVARKSRAAEEVCAGKITAHATNTGAKMGQVPSFKMRCCSRDERHVQKRHVGTMRMRSIFDCRPASWRARNITVATFNASEG